MPVPQEVIKLIENFERNLDAYRSGKSTLLVFCGDKNDSYERRKG